MRTDLAVLAGLAATAFAQPTLAQAPSGAGVAADLMREASCSMDTAEAGLRERMAALDLPPVEIHQALTEISLGDGVCNALRAAAANLASELVTREADAEWREISVRDAEVAAAVAAIVDDAFSEADQRAARLTFEVGPPPRNLTRGRISSPE